MKLKEMPIPKGLNRNKLKIVFVILIASFFIVLAYIMMRDPMPNNASSGNSLSNKAIDYAKNNLNTNIDDIINPSKDTAVINNIVSESHSSSAKADIPPLISARGNTPFDTPLNMVDPELQNQLKQIKHQQQVAKLQAEIAAYSSKTNLDVKANNMYTGSNSSSESVALANNEVPENQGSTDITGEAGRMNGVGTGAINTKVNPPSSPYTLYAGGIIPAVMISGINSDLNGEIIAQVRENVYDAVSGRYLVIPQGSKLIGVYNSKVSYGQNRLMVAWNRLIYPNGNSVNLKGQPGTDISGFSGVSDQIDNHYWKIFGTSFVMGVITAGMQYSQNNTNPNAQSGNNLNLSPTVGQTLSGSLGQQMGQTSMMIAQKGINIAPTITIRQGYAFNIMLTADLVLQPYKEN